MTHFEIFQTLKTRLDLGLQDSCYKQNSTNLYCEISTTLGFTERVLTKQEIEQNNKTGVNILITHPQVRMTFSLFFLKERP